MYSFELYTHLHVQVLPNKSKQNKNVENENGSLMRHFVCVEIGTFKYYLELSSIF